MLVSVIRVFDMLDMCVKFNGNGVYAICIQERLVGGCTHGISKCTNILYNLLKTSEYVYILFNMVMNIH